MGLSWSGSCAWYGGAVQCSAGAVLAAPAWCFCGCLWCTSVCGAPQSVWHQASPDQHLELSLTPHPPTHLLALLLAPLPSVPEAHAVVLIIHVASGQNDGVRAVGLLGAAVGWAGGQERGSGSRSAAGEGWNKLGAAGWQAAPQPCCSPAAAVLCSCTPALALTITASMSPPTCAFCCSSPHVERPSTPPPHHHHHHTHTHHHHHHTHTPPPPPPPRMQHAPGSDPAHPALPTHLASMPLTMALCMPSMHSSPLPVNTMPGLMPGMWPWQGAGVC